MRLGLSFAIMSLVSFCIMTRHRTSAGYEETLEKGKEHREEQEENTEASSAVSNAGALGWRRRRNVMEMNPKIDERTAKSFNSKVK